MEICVKISLINMFFYFLVFLHDFILYFDFNRIAASNSANDYVTN